MTHHGQAVATISPLANRTSGPDGLIGSLNGRVLIADDFDNLGQQWNDYIN